MKESLSVESLAFGHRKTTKWRRMSCQNQISTQIIMENGKFPHPTVNPSPQPVLILRIFSPIISLFGLLSIFRYTHSHHNSRIFILIFLLQFFPSTEFIITVKNFFSQIIAFCARRG